MTRRSFKRIRLMNKKVEMKRRRELKRACGQTRSMIDRQRNNP